MVILSKPEIEFLVKLLDCHIEERGLLLLSIVHANYCVAMPDNLSFVEAAAMPLVSITAMSALLKCGIKEKVAGTSKVLITGGAGGVGSQAIQIAKKIFNAATVVTTASAGKKEKLCKDSVLIP